MNARSAHAYVRALTGITMVTVVIAAGGCASVYDVKVDAINNPNARGGQAYCLVSKHAAVEANDPDYGRASCVVRAALAGKGMYEVANAGDADVVVEIDYGVGPRRLKVTEVSSPPVFADASRPPVIPARSSGAGNGMLFPTGPVPAALADPAGATAQLEVTPVYEKYLTIVARESAPAVDGDRRTTEVWRVHATLEDPVREVAPVLPLLAGAAADRIGADTHARQTVRVSEKSDVVAFVSRDL
jgi:hypothetical protein